MDYLIELEAFGLVEKKKRGFGLPSIIYVKSFMTSEAARSIEMGTTGKVRNLRDTGSSETDTSAGFQIVTSRGVETNTSEVPKSIPQEAPVSAALKNNTYMNQTNKSDMKSNHIVSCPGRDEMR